MLELLEMGIDDQEKNDDYYLELSADPIRFESVSCLTNVFFDDSKQQVSQYIYVYLNFCIFILYYYTVINIICIYI